MFLSEATEMGGRYALYAITSICEKSRHGRSKLPGRDPPRRLRALPTPPYGRATAPWVRVCHILHSTHHSARSRRTRAVSDSTASSGRNSASSRSPALVLGCPFLSFSSTFRSRHQSLYLSSMVGYSNPEIQICKSAKS